MKKLFWGKKIKVLSEKYEGLRFSLYIASFLLVIFLLVEMVLLLYWSMLSFYSPGELEKSANFQSAPVTMTNSPQRLKINYLTQIETLTNNLNQADLDISNYQTIKADLLEIYVPKEYLDWHFRLVVAVDKILEFMILQSSSPSLEHEQLVSSQAAYISQYLTTINHVTSGTNE